MENEKSSIESSAEDKQKEDIKADDLEGPHVPGAGPIILHGARSLTVEFADGHTIQISF